MLRSVESKYDGFMTWSIQLYDMHCACLWQCGDVCHTHPQWVRCDRDKSQWQPL